MTAKQPFKRQHNADTDLFRQPTCLTGFTIDFEVAERSILTAHGHCDVVHRNLVVGPVGYSAQLSLKRADSLAELGPLPSWSTPPGAIIWGSTNGGNIRDIEDHYGKVALNGREWIEPGAYRLMAHAKSHSSSAPYTDGLIEVLVEGGRGLNCLIVDVEPAP